MLYLWYTTPMTFQSYSMLLTPTTTSEKPHMRKYILRKDKDVYVDPDNHQQFNYSDGDDSENYLLDLVSKAADLSIGSEELISGIKDWPSLYHLSPKRADLMRPLAGLLKDRSVLEIGSGCGAITRYLGELGCQVTALEGSLRRAQITRQRCRELSNVTVICDNFQHFSVDEKFDVITLIGVLEYSNLFIDAEFPPEAMLQQLSTFLNPGGQVIIAIENKLGLKYLAGAPEDHLDKPYFGIENKYSSSTVSTFGKAELKKILERSGFPQPFFLYPFPDYKLPTVILTEKGVRDESLLVGELLTEKLEYFQHRVYTNNFSTTLAAEAFAQNHLLSHFSNSFLVVASPDTDQPPPTHNALAYTYSTHRKKPFCKENIFDRGTEGPITVIKRRLYDLPPDPQSPIRQQISDETYYQGILLSKSVVALVSRNGWTLEDLRPWAQAYYTILSKYAVIKNNQPLLEGKYVDLTPFNILLKNGSDIHIFDQEWIIREELPVHYVFFRGVRFTLGALSFFSPPAEGTPLNLLQLSLAIVNTAFNFTPQMLDDCLAREKKYFSHVNFGELQSFDCGDIRIRGVYHLEQQFLHQQDELNHLNARIEHIHSFNESQSTSLNESQAAARHLQAELEDLRNEADRLRMQLNETSHQLSETSHQLNKASYLLDETNHQLDETRHAVNDEKEKIQLLEQEKDWYIRTYAKRSLLGLIKDRIRIFK